VAGAEEGPRRASAPGEIRHLGDYRISIVTIGDLDGDRYPLQRRSQAPAHEEPVVVHGHLTVDIHSAGCLDDGQDPPDGQIAMVVRWWWLPPSTHPQGAGCRLKDQGWRPLTVNVFPSRSGSKPEPWISSRVPGHPSPGEKPEIASPAAAERPPMADRTRRAADDSHRTSHMFAPRSPARTYVPDGALGTLCHLYLICPFQSWRQAVVA
jgi:hypothetical protein